MAQFHPRDSRWNLSEGPRINPGTNEVVRLLICVRQTSTSRLRANSERPSGRAACGPNCSATL